MAGSREGDRDDVSTGRFTIDSSYLRQQAGEAFWAFYAPLSGVYGAAMNGHRTGARSVSEQS